MKKTLTATALTALALALAPTAHADETVHICPSGVSGYVTADTSCPFADNVRAAWYAQPGHVIYVYSPVTGLMYTMDCNPDAWTGRWGEAKRCVGMSGGGDTLIVYVD
jgi:hypothetical protein